MGQLAGKEHETSMGCTKPLVRFKNGQITSLKKYLWSDEHARKEGIIIDGIEIVSQERELLNMLRLDEAQLIPCGQCTGCKLQNSSSWANRMEMELPYHKNAWFLTLTYDNEHVPYRYTYDKLTGEVITENLSLCDEDMQKFWKRLRRWLEYHERNEEALMYFQAGEYGSKTHRPHYHAIVYSLPIQQDELKTYKKEKGYTYYNVDWITKLWSMGHVVIAAAEWKNMAYTARYTTKKVYGKAGQEYYQELGITPERCMMSKGIGQRYYFEHRDEIYAKDSIQLANGKTCKPPRYFDKLFDLEHSNSAPLSEAETTGIEDTIVKAESEELRAIKRERRRIANDALFAQLQQTGLNMQEYYTAKDKAMQDRMKKLIREEI